MSSTPEVKTNERNPHHTQRILVVDDSDSNRALLVRRMTGLGYEVESADSGPNALEHLRGTSHFDLVLLDIIMPGMSGLEVLKQIREDFSAIRLPVIMVSALDESSSIAEALNLGANDYITKPVDAIVARARIRTHLKLKEAEEAIHRMDAMSGLGNRLYFSERLDEAFARCRSTELGIFTVVVFGLDRYYMITESLGPDASEELARQIADRLKHNVRQSDTIARLGDNEFAILIEAAPDSPTVLAVNDFLQNGLHGPFQIHGTEITGSASAGVACYVADYERAEHVLRDAGIARNRAKDLGGNRLMAFHDRMHTDSTRLLQTESELRRGLQRDELHVFYQPIISALTGRVTGFEALVRWIHPERGLVGPGEFIPLAEATGLIVPLGEYVLEAVCKQLTRWDHTPLGSLFVAVNVSARQFANPDSIERIKKIIGSYASVVPRLKMEITESTVMHDVEHSTRTLRHFNDIGISISIDDFGTGYSSLALLKSLPISTLKIDRSFVRDLSENSDDRAIISAILALSRQLKLSVVAEGIETESQREFLSNVECDEFQGFYFSPPLAIEDLEKLVHRSLDQESGPGNSPIFANWKSSGNAASA
ncbi:MAG: EAL domain-containing protein [bacterium]|nr:EAL domain-containing protein [bacterium]